MTNHRVFDFNWLAIYSIYNVYRNVCQVERLSANQLKSNTLWLVIA